MTLAILIAFVMLSVIVGTCAGPTEETASSTTAPPAPAASATGNAAHDRLAALSNSDRNALLTKLMASEQCGSVTRNFYQGMGNGEAFWNVACSNGSAYVIQIKPDATGSTSIMDCGVLKAVGGGECFKKFE